MVLTRTPADNARLRTALAGVDAEIVEYPCIGIEPLAADPRVLERLKNGAYESVFFVSRNAVRFLFSQVEAPCPARVVALGASTAEELARHGWKGAVLPTIARLEVAVQELTALFPSQGRVLSVRGELGLDTLPEALRARGVEVDVAIVHATVDPVDAPLPADDRPTILTFASPSAVRHFASRNAVSGAAIAIGETTAEAARNAGFSVAVAASNDVDAVAAGIRRLIAR